MTSLNCFCPSWKKKNNKRGKEHVNLSVKEKNLNTLHVELDHLQISSETTELRSSSFSVPVPFCIPGSSRCNVKVMNHDSPVAGDPSEVAYEGEDEHDESSPSEMINFQPCSKNFDGEKGQNIQGTKSFSSLDINDGEFNFEACLENSNEEKSQTLREVKSFCSLNIADNDENHNTEPMLEMNACGHASDPGTREARFWASPELKRSCSSLAIRSASLAFEEKLLLSKGKSYEDMQRLAEMHSTGFLVGDGGSPVSIRTRCSADKVILKKHSSSGILPSGSRKLWWKLFLWSHRNLHRTGSTKPFLSEVEPTPLYQLGGGYSSDTVEPKHATGSRKLRSPSPLSKELVDSNMNDKNWNGFYGPSSMWPQNQWFAFPPNSPPLMRVDEWVKEVCSQPPCEGDICDHHSEDDILFPSSPENGASSPRGGPSHLSRPSNANMAEEISHANNVIRSLNANSTAAHVTSLGLVAIPSFSPFSSLRSVNLSGNLIVQKTPGSLPKGLHVLNLSRNKISTIEGLRELTRLRVLDLSYNRISRIGQGLSNCTLIKELYLAGNKISTVEGLHRLLKLTVLGLSFNKITTAKALGQLVANYNTLIAVNLLGNPIQSNLSDDLLRKTLCGLLPKLVLLNNQPINPRKARELRANANAKAALGNSNSSSMRRKAVRKGTTQGSSSHSVRRSVISTSNKSKHRSRSHSRHHSNLKDKA